MSVTGRLRRYGRAGARPRRAGPVAQRQADLAQRVGNVALGDFAETAQVAEGVLELAAQGIEHLVKLGQRDPVDKSGAGSLDSQLAFGAFRA